MKKIAILATPSTSPPALPPTLQAAPLQAQLAGIDWSAPWWAPWRDVGQQVAQRVLQGARVCDALNAQLAAQPTPAATSPATPPATPPTPQPPAPLQFAPQSALPEGVAYEAFIFETGQVPTRENLHDFFNGLAWLVFPHTKRRLNALQYGELAASGVQSTRGALRDALTLFDENAAIWPCAPSTTAPGAAPPPAMALLAALRAKDWQRACIDLRADWQHTGPVLFGHALLEKLVNPYKSITAHVYIAQTATDLVATSTLDAATAAQLCRASLVPKPFIALPVLGVPQWWAGNANPLFYADPQVFRAAKTVV